MGRSALRTRNTGDPQMIDWTAATDEELGELYDALYERNDRITKSLDQIHIRLGSKRSNKFFDLSEHVRGPSYDLADQVRGEFKRRHPPNETSEQA